MNSGITKQAKAPNLQLDSFWTRPTTRVELRIRQWKPQGGEIKRALMNARRRCQLSSTNLQKKNIYERWKTECVLSRGGPSLQEQNRGDLCWGTHVFHYSLFSNVSPRLVASQSAREGGLGSPDLDLFQHPNCLLNIIDHQSCDSKEGWGDGVGWGSHYMYHTKGSIFWKSYLSKECVRIWTGRQKIGPTSTINTTLVGCRIN